MASKDGGATPTLNEKLTQDELAKQAAQMDALLGQDALAASGWDDGPGSIELGGKLGVMQRVITAVMDDKEFRQILLLGAFDDKTEALLVSDAIDECQRYGVEIGPILNRVIAQCAVNSGQVNRVLNAFTQRNLTTNFNNAKKGWRSSNNDAPQE